MSVIGTFTATKEGGWSGAIHTLTLNAKIRFVPNDNRENESAPAFRVYAGHSEIGAAWQRQSGGDHPKLFLSVRLDDPCLPEPLMAALFARADTGEAQLIWKR
ncbi:MAG TPA: DUF736 domain-containing protein [Dongiaceae bacterium]|jgi:uncharacterized protein (DUF736 family)|nr:DUF736 domain-containing protein [Dongiaceae bacterium]